MARASRWASQAALDALLRFNPQEQSLREQIKEAQGTYNTAVRAGRLGARETQRSVQRALPQLQQAYSAADAASKPGVTLVSQALAGLPPDTAQYRANQAGYGATFAAQLAAARADAQRVMLERGTRASEGAQFGQTQAAGNLASTLQTIFGRQRSLSGERGAFAQADLEKLEHEAETLNQRETASKRTAASAAAGQKSTAQTAREGREQKAKEHAEDLAQKKWEHEHPSSKAKGAGGYEIAPGVKEATQDQTNKAKDTIEAIRHEAFYVARASHHSYNQANEMLQNPVPTAEGVQGRKGYPANGLLRAGLDLAYFGGVGAGAAQTLHKEGFSLKRLGYPLYRAPARGPLTGLTGSSGRR